VGRPACGRTARSGRSHAGLTREEDATRNSNIEERRVAGALGAELHGVNLAESTNERTFHAIRQAFADHAVIFISD
jgi:hypothetical protein